MSIISEPRSIVLPDFSKGEVHGFLSETERIMLRADGRRLKLDAPIVGAFTIECKGGAF